MMNKKLIGCLVAIGFLVLSAMALPQSKSDFEKASRETIGCGLIPYDNLHSKCRYAYGVQREWCTGDKERGCADLPKDQKDEARKRRDNADECLKQRKEVRQAYIETLDQLSREKREDFKPFVDDIVKKINAHLPTHDEEIDKTQRRRDKCNDLL